MSSQKSVKNLIFEIRHGTLTAEFKMVYLQIYIKLIYVIIIVVQPRKTINLLWLCSFQQSKILVVTLVRKNHGIFEHLLRQLYLLHQFGLCVTSDTTEAFSTEFSREVWNHIFQQSTVGFNKCTSSVTLGPSLSSLFFSYLISPALQSDYKFIVNINSKT